MSLRHRSRVGSQFAFFQSGRGLALPDDVPVPETIQKFLRTPPHREFMERTRYLPYVVLEFEKNEIFIDGDLSTPVWNYPAHFDVSRPSNVSVSAYLRTDKTLQSQNFDMSNDLFLARVTVTDVYNSDRWYPATVGRGSFNLRLELWQPTRDPTLSIEVFDLLKIIGTGSSGKVMQVRKKDTRQIYALKTIRKAHVIAQRPDEIPQILPRPVVVDNPFITPLEFSFETPFMEANFPHTYNVMVDLDRSRFYAAELLCALGFLHGLDVVYRELRPENILLDSTGHITLCDFGLYKLNTSEAESREQQAEDRDTAVASFSGNGAHRNKPHRDRDPREKRQHNWGYVQYTAPELLEGQEYTTTVDWWTLGVLLYAMMTGRLKTLNQRILSEILSFPPDIPFEARSAVGGLVERDPLERLGANGSDEIKRHPFFVDIDWDGSVSVILAKEYPPPFKPGVVWVPRFVIPPKRLALCSYVYV
ncbi:AGC/Akt protein kinase [Mycena metata]|uniref:AGC/Akt protein kinase n=1 Tax=Mycena metata TaxID=1033252 RepID=A0AAD7HQN0_9AGAR|nr:AGC/Akt protein kinase [Mycena metata]